MKKFLKLEELLETVSESQAFEPEDELTALIRETEQNAEDELSFDELDMVAAAANTPDFGEFLKAYNEKKKR